MDSGSTNEDKADLCPGLGQKKRIIQERRYHYPTVSYVVSPIQTSVAVFDMI